MKTTTPAFRALPLALVLALAGAGCANQTSGTAFGRSETGQMQTVQQGVVQSVRVVTIGADGRNVAGAVTGAAVGGAVGNTPVATVAGAAAGSAVQGSAANRPGVELTVLLDNGQTVAIVQEGPPDQFRPGDKVNLTTSGNTTRVSRR
jgi:outer membrane lipoprotein SlyB